MSAASAVSEATIRSRLAYTPAGSYGTIRSGNKGKHGGNMASGAAARIGGALRKTGEVIHRFEFGPATAVVGLFVIAVLLGLLYLAHFNQVATKGYDLRRLEADRQQLLSQFDIKNMKLAEAQSMATVIASDRVSGMRRPNQITWVRANTALASNFQVSSGR